MNKKIKLYNDKNMLVIDNDGKNYQIFTKNEDGIYKDITKTLTETDKEELINTLYTFIQTILNNIHLQKGQLTINDILNGPESEEQKYIHAALECIQKLNTKFDFEKISEKEFDIGYQVDEIFKIMKNKQHIGYLCMSKTIQNIPFIEWIEFLPEHQHKSYIRKILSEIKNKYTANIIKFECNPTLKALYEHIGATELEYDTFREMYLMQI